MLHDRHGVLPALLLAAVSAVAGCPKPDEKDMLYEPVPLVPHEVAIAADAEGDAKHPAHVAVFLQRGILALKGGGAHTLEGVLVGAPGDAPPRVERMQDRVAVTQAAVGGSPPRGDGRFVLALGSTPIGLEVETGTGEAQSIDLGAVSVTKAHFHTTSGHLSIDWTSPNPAPGGVFSFDTDAGYIDVAHVGRSGASRIDVASTAGLVSLDVGDLAAAYASPIDVRVTVTSGTFILRVPPRVTALATIEAPPGTVVPKGWTAGEAAGTWSTGPSAAPQVTLRLSAKGGRVELRTD